MSPHRYADALTQEQADNIRRERWQAVSAAISWVAIGGLVAALAPHFPKLIGGL